MKAYFLLSGNLHLCKQRKKEKRNGQTNEQTTKLIMLCSPVIQLLTSLILVGQTAFSLGQKQVISFQSQSSSFPLVTSSQTTPLLVSSDDYIGIHRASNTFASDLFKVTGQTPQVVKDDFSQVANSSEHRQAIIVGSLEQSSLVKMLVDNGKVNVSDISGVWEAFKMVVVDSPMNGVDRALVIIGNDKRGTIFGLYDLSEQMGVSPWNWWADVATTHKDEVYFSSADGYGHGEPSVKYRGFFLNDEQPSLTNWAKKYYGNNDTAVFKHEFYEGIYELILRLKGNMFWPAMWAAMFALDDPLNQFLADEYGVIYGTSHQEPMARNTPEWANFGKGNWNYTSNKNFLDNFWTEGVERSKNFETLYTVGMRGNGDLPLPGANIPLVENIVANQQRILTNVTGKTSQEIPQVWCLFKEVQSYWEQGLTAPDEITLLWTDDNFGNVRRLPTTDERKRSGGSGLYYHFDMVIDDPRNYKWINTNSIPKIWEQLHLTKAHGADRLWIVNVGDLKPMEIPLSFWFDYAYDTTRWNKDNLDEYLELWATREFGQDVAAATASVVSRYTRYVSRQKPELTSPDTYSLINYREAETVIGEWKNVTDDAWKIYNGLAAEKKSSFFQLVLHPCRAIYTVTLLNIRAGQNYLRATQAHMSTNTMAQDVLDLFREDAAITREYHTVSNGKWDHMMDQPHLGSYYWQQPMINSIPPITWVQGSETTLPGAMRLTIEGSKGAWPGDNSNQCAIGYNCPPPTLPTLTQYGPKSRYFEVGQGSGVTNFTFVVAPNATFVKLSATSGSVLASDESTWQQRIEMTVPDWSQVPEGTSTIALSINSTTSDPSFLPAGIAQTFTLYAVVVKKSVSSGFKGFVEADGGISMEAAHMSRNTSVNGTSWEVIPGYSSRALSGGVTMFPVTSSNFTAGHGPKVEYDFYNFNNQSSGNVTVNVYMGMSFNFMPHKPIKYAIQIDNNTAQVVQPVPYGASEGDNPPDWSSTAKMMVRVSSTNHTLTSTGAHTLSVWGIEPAFVLEKIVIDTGGVKSSYLGMPESQRV